MTIATTKKDNSQQDLSKTAIKRKNNNIRNCFQKHLEVNRINWKSKLIFNRKKKQTVQFEKFATIMNTSTEKSQTIRK